MGSSISVLSTSLKQNRAKTYITGDDEESDSESESEYSDEDSESSSEEEFPLPLYEEMQFDVIERDCMLAKKRYAGVMVHAR
jgi:hypothetical protein